MTVKQDILKNLQKKFEKTTDPQKKKQLAGRIAAMKKEVQANNSQTSAQRMKASLNRAGDQSRRDTTPEGGIGLITSIIPFAGPAGKTMYRAGQKVYNSIKAARAAKNVSPTAPVLRITGPSSKLPVVQQGRAVGKVRNPPKPTLKSAVVPAATAAAAIAATSGRDDEAAPTAAASPPKPPASPAKPEKVTAPNIDPGYASSPEKVSSGGRGKSRGSTGGETIGEYFKDLNQRNTKVKTPFGLIDVDSTDEGMFGDSELYDMGQKKGGRLKKAAGKKAVKKNTIRKRAALRGHRAELRGG